MSFLQMDPDVVEEAGRRLRASGDRLAVGWGRASSAIATYEGGIGTGRLADAFGHSYLPASRRARANADPFPARVIDLGRATSLAAYRYVEVDALVAEQFRRLQNG